MTKCYNDVNSFMINEPLQVLRHVFKYSFGNFWIIKKCIFDSKSIVYITCTELQQLLFTHEMLTGYNVDDIIILAHRHENTHGN